MENKELSYALLRTLMDASPYQWVLWNIKTDQLWIDPRMSEQNLFPDIDQPTPDLILASIEEIDAERMRENLLDLIHENIPFEQSAMLKSSGRTFNVMAHRLNPDQRGDLCLFWIKERNAEQELSEVSSTTLREILDEVPIPIWHRSIHGRIDFCNKAYADILETSPEVVLRKNQKIWTGNLFAEQDENGEPLEDERAEKRQLRQHTIINGARHLLEYVEINMGDEGEVGYALDMTGVEISNRELERHIEAHRKVLEHLTAGVAVYGSDKRLKFFNHAYLRLYDWDESWLLTEPTLNEMFDELHRRRLMAEQADFPAYKKKWMQMFNSLLNPIQELVHLPNERTIRMIASPHPMGGLFFVFEDVTDSLVLERQVNTQVAVQRETLDHLYEGVVVFASDNRLKLTNPAFTRLWKINPEQLKAGCHISDLVEQLKNFFDYGNNWDSYKAAIIENFTDRVPKSGRLNRKDRSVLEFSYVPLPDGAHLISYSDVTDSHLVERALRERNEALEEADQLKSEFLSNISYELKDPLNTIIGFTEILASGYFGQLRQEQITYTKGTLESSRQLLALVNDIIDLATIEAGQMTLNMQTIDIRKLLNSLVGMVKSRAEALDVKVSMSCASELKELTGDERRLKQALFNLLNNSLRFTPKGGKVVLSANLTNNFVQITVADTGAGIARKDQKRVFKKFERTEDAADRYKGAGLGLPLVKSLVELHGGKVTIMSQQNAGTKVVCQLPMNLPHNAQQELLKIA
jgi:signal transduction histidine kinase